MIGKENGGVRQKVTVSKIRLRKEGAIVAVPKI
jgi:hypothetical protein